MPRSIEPACSAVSRRCLMSEQSMPASRASWRSSSVLGLISTLSISAFRLGVALRASSTHCNVRAVFPAPGAPPISVTSPGSDFDPGKLASTDRIEGRRLSAQNIVAPGVEQVGQRREAITIQKHQRPRLRGLLEVAAGWTFRSCAQA